MYKPTTPQKLNLIRVLPAVVGGGHGADQYPKVILFCQTFNSLLLGVSIIAQHFDSAEAEDISNKYYLQFINKKIAAASSITSITY